MKTAAFVLMAMAWAGVLAVAAPGDEPAPVITEGFEEGRDRWAPASVGEVDTAQKHEGQASLKLADRDAARYFTVDQTVAVLPDTQYELSFWCYTQDALHASLCLLQRAADGQPAEAAGKRLVSWLFPFEQGQPVGRWVHTRYTLVTGPNTHRCTVILNPADGSREHTGTAWYDDISLRYAGRPVPPAERSIPLKPLPPLEIDLGSSDGAILCPAGDDLKAAAEELAGAIERKAGRRPRVLNDTSDPASLGRGPLLVMGNLALSAAAKRLYLEGHDFTDHAWPGQGGHVVRTIRDPFATGAHVVLVGGSTPEDVVSAAGRLSEILAARGPRLGYLNDVKLGRNADLIAGWSSECLREDYDWKREGSLGSWEYLWRIGKAGMGYLRTGDEAYLPLFKRELLLFFENDVLHYKHEAPPQIHSVIDAVLLPWDLLADHPFFTAEDRRDLDEKFLVLACSPEGPRPLKDAGWALRGNHGLGRALDGFWLARYFDRRYAIPEAQDWLQIVDRYFAPQLHSSKPTEDGGYHQFPASLLCTLAYALATGNQEYLQGRALREATDRAVLEHRVGRGPMTYLGARAVAADDPGYLCLMAHAGKDAYLRHCAAMASASLLGENLRSFCGFDTPREKPELLGARIAPLDPMWHGLMQSNSGPTELMVTTPPEASYDKLVIRDGYSPDSFRLMMDGLGAGGHSFQDANCITAYEERGVPWLFEEYGYSGPTCSTIRQQNGVFVALDGQGPPGVHVCARLLYARSLAAGLEAAGGALDGIGDVAWERHLLRKRDAWTLVVDRAVARKQGELYVERHWHIRPGGKAAPVVERDGVSLYQCGGAVLHLQSEGLGPGAVSGTSHRIETVRTRLSAPGHLDLASLIQVDASPQTTRYRLTRTADGWTVTDGTDRSAMAVKLGSEGLALSMAPTRAEPLPPPVTLPLKPQVAPAQLPWRTVALGEEVTAVAAGPDGFAAATRQGTVAVYAKDGTRRWQAKVNTWVLALHFLGNDLLVGEDEGTISRFAATGERAWSVTIPYVHIGWPHWSDRRSRIRDITSADLNGDGEQEILLSNGDRRLYAYTGGGKPLWNKGVQWGVSVALTPTTYLGKFALFSGVTGPTLTGTVHIHDADGNTAGSLQVSHVHSQQIRDLRLFDLTGDGKREIIVARDVPSNQLVVCNEEREPLWQADVAGSPDALAIRGPAGTAQVLCASRCGYMHALEGGTGKPLWFAYLGDDPRMLWAQSDETTLALCPSGKVFVVAGDGKLVGQEVLSAPVTALLRPGEPRVSPSCLPVGTADGTVYVLPID
ncbi:MAG: hypothetical protein KKA73_13410 [Chloroflexi bacterium]|nr:hypothetical protein [Chloroflexota bacterium]